jgi:hypothetical protein
MKILIYFLLIIAFLMFYQKNPLFAIIFIALTVGIYLFLKARKLTGSTSSCSFLTGSHGTQVKNTEDLVKLMLLQHMITSGRPSLDQQSSNSSAINKFQENIEKTKQEVLELLES